MRNLAQNLQVNPSTVVNAYKELEKNGFIFSKRGSGSGPGVVKHALEDLKGADFTQVAETIKKTAC